MKQHNIPYGEGPRFILDNIETAKSWSGDLQKATETAQKMGDIDKLVAIAMKQALSDATTQAIETAQKIPDPSVSSTLLHAFAMGYVWLDDVKQAINIAQGISDKSFRSVLLGEIAMSYTKSSDDAIKLIRQIPDKEVVSMFLTDIVLKQVLSGNIVEAIKVVEEVEEKDILSEVLEVIGESIEALIEAQASIE